MHISRGQFRYVARVCGSINKGGNQQIAQGCLKETSVGQAEYSAHARSQRVSRSTGHVQLRPEKFQEAETHKNLCKRAKAGAQSSVAH